MLIGVVGLISSGKGTVADRLVEKHGYQKDSFAKSLKDAVASMFNWDRSMLEGIWVDSCIGRYKGQNTVIADTRFPNEVKQIREHGGKIILVKRGPDPDWFVDYVEGNIEPKGVHSSEYAWAKEEFDFVIENNGTKEDLYAKIDALIVSDKITDPPSKPPGATQPLAIGANSF